MKTLKTTIAVTLVLIMALALIGCGAKKEQDDWTYIQEKGKLIVGITLYEPMNYYDAENKLVGFDTEFTKALCDKLGLEPEFIIIDWNNKETELAGRTIDCIWNGLTVTEERKANMAFTDTYLKNEQVVVIRSADAEKYTSTDSLKGVSVAAEEGSAGATAIENDLAEAKLVAVAAQSDALLEVKAGTSEAAVIDYTMASAMVGADTDFSDLMVVATIDMMDEEYAIGFRLESPAVEKANEAIQALTADGTMAALAEKYDLTDKLIVG